MKRIIRLKRKSWEFDDEEPLAPAGGFGQVYACPLGVAIKRLSVEAEDAKRELSLADTLADGTFDHIVPVFDAGEDADKGGFFIVMARCDYSLQDYLKQQGGLLPFPNALSIIVQIAKGLKEANGIVHRDIKPQNILFHNGAWKIADFGIAKFIEDSTSLETLRGCLSPPYAAPEQWLSEHPTTTTDIYSLACVAVTLLTGRPPYNASDNPSWQAAHLHSEPLPFPDCIPSKMRSLLSMMLRKNPESRPSLDRVLHSLERFESTPQDNKILSILSDVDASISAEAVQKEARARAVLAEQAKKEAISEEAAKEVAVFKDQIFSTIKDAAQNAIIDDWKLSFGKAEIQLQRPVLPRKGRTFSGMGWTIYASSIILIRQLSLQCAWSSSLWFGNASGSSELRWYALAFMENPNARKPRHMRAVVTHKMPFGIDLSQADAAMSLTHYPALYVLAGAAAPIDGEDFDAFKDEWIERFALAAQGRMRPPHMMIAPS